MELRPVRGGKKDKGPCCIWAWCKMANRRRVVAQLDAEAQSFQEFEARWVPIRAVLKCLTGVGYRVAWLERWD